MRWRPCQEKQTYTGEVVEYQKKLMAFGLMYKHVVAAWFSEPTTETILRKPATKARRPKTGGADTNGNNKGSGGVGAGQTGGADTNGNNNDSGGVGAGQTGGADTNGNNNDSGGLRAYRCRMFFCGTELLPQIYFHDFRTRASTTGLLLLAV